MHLQATPDLVRVSRRDGRGHRQAAWRRSSGPGPTWRRRRYCSALPPCCHGVVLGGGGPYPRTDYARRVGFTIDQPVPFSHQHHVAGLGYPMPAMPFLGGGVGEGGDAADLYLHDLPLPEIWTKADAAGGGRCATAWRVTRQSRGAGSPTCRITSISITASTSPRASAARRATGRLTSMPLTYKGRHDDDAVLPRTAIAIPGPQLRPASEIYNTEWVRPARHAVPPGDGGAITASAAAT